jgi:hypothetical protein
LSRVRRALSSAGLVAAAACVVAGCGGGDTKSASGPAPSTPASTQAAPPQTATAPAPTSPPTTTPTTPTKPPPSTTSTVPGGSEPARTELTFTASKSGITPRRASVAPFVAVRVSLVSKDGSSHTLAIGGHALKVGGTRKSAFVQLPGLRPGKSYTGKADGRVTIRILSSSEPGP